MIRVQNATMHSSDHYYGEVQWGHFHSILTLHFYTMEFPILHPVLLWNFYPRPEIFARIRTSILKWTLWTHFPCSSVQCSHQQYLIRRKYCWWLQCTLTNVYKFIECTNHGNDSKVEVQGWSVQWTWKMIYNFHFRIEVLIQNEYFCTIFSTLMSVQT